MMLFLIEHCCSVTNNMLILYTVLELIGENTSKKTKTITNL